MFGPEPKYEIPVPSTEKKDESEQEKSRASISVKVEVDCSELDVAIEKVKQLVGLCKELQGMRFLAADQQKQEIDIEQFADKLADCLKCSSFGVASHDFEELEESEEQNAIDCMVQHISNFFSQSVERKTADYGEPCKKCKYIKKCNLDWLSIMHPLLKKSSVKISVVHPERTNTQDSDRKDPGLDKDIPQNAGMNNCPSYKQDLRSRP